MHERGSLRQNGPVHRFFGQYSGYHRSTCSSLSETAALQLILQHICQQAQHHGHEGLQSVARLLCTCKRLHVPIAQHCSGLVSMTITSTLLRRAPGQVTAWLSRHGQLLGELNMQLRKAEEVESVLQALLKAAVASDRLQLRKLASTSLGIAAAHPTDVCDQLPQLQSLTLQYIPGEPFVQAMCGLQHLTAVDMGLVGPAMLIQQLPVQLVECSVTVRAETTKLNLKQFTALQRLSVEGLTAAAGSQFPTTLKSLSMNDCKEVQDLLQLQQLTQLIMKFTCLPADQLRCLSRLQHMSDVYLHYHAPGGAAAAAAAAAWPALPIRGLSMFICGEDDVIFDDVPPAPAGITQALRQLTGLTSLCIESYFTLEATPQQMADVLKQNTGLKQLALEATAVNELLLVRAGNPDLMQAGWQYLARSSYTPVLDALAHLPHLTDFSIRLPMLRHSEVDTLAAAGGRLTRLNVSWEGLDDYAVCMLASSLTGLKCLEVGYPDTAQIGGASAVVVCNCLTQLTKLALSGRDVNDSSVKHLTRLHSLAELDLQGTCVTGGMVRQLAAAHRADPDSGDWRWDFDPLHPLYWA